MRKLLFVIILFACAASYAQDNYLEKGKEYLSYGHYEKAIGKFQAEIRYNKNETSEVYYLLAQAHLGYNKDGWERFGSCAYFDDAWDNCVTALEKDSTNYEIYNTMYETKSSQARCMVDNKQETYTYDEFLQVVNDAIWAIKEFAKYEPKRARVKDREYNLEQLKDQMKKYLNAD